MVGSSWPSMGCSANGLSLIPGDLRIALVFHHNVTLTPETDVMDAKPGASGRWLVNPTGTGGTITLAESSLIPLHGSIDSSRRVTRIFAICCLTL